MALFLRGRGYRACALLGGFNAWRDAGFPLSPRDGTPSNGRVPSGPLDKREHG